MEFKVFATLGEAPLVLKQLNTVGELRAQIQDAHGQHTIVTFGGEAIDQPDSTMLTDIRAFSQLDPKFMRSIELNVRQPGSPESISVPSERAPRGGLPCSSARSLEEPTGVLGLLTIDHSTELGRAANGTVYAGIWYGRDTQRGEPCAVKSVGEEYKEMAALTRLSHPHIVQYLGCTQLNGKRYMATERCELPLDRAVSQLTDRHAACEQLASSVQYVHSQQLAHRDLKPQNVLLTRGVLDSANQLQFTPEANKLQFTPVLAPVLLMMLLISPSEH